MSVLGLLLMLVGLQASVTRSEPYYGVPIGPLRSYAHGITGFVYAASEDTIFIKGFSYDGSGPDAFFWIGYETDGPSPQGILLPYPDDGSAKPNVLQQYSNADVVLRLPAGQKVQNMKWLSIWCRRFTVSLAVLSSFRAPVRPPVVSAPGAWQLGRSDRIRGCIHGIRGCVHKTALARREKRPNRNKQTSKCDMLARKRCFYFLSA
ncbi:protein Skeletor, isoforms B/C-like [Pollicipes pollicipes]|uniref:protein Skeletor, isoforms B/C-like n=1 Tax=Pollicipes pollicipes TaxID=41117 RepID=UPI0018858CFE|nr:protein Skeletor, isoforms B/C-like [Pollicipes pollicipes]